MPTLRAVAPALLAASLLMAGTAGPAGAQPAAPLPASPFAGFETRHLPNGLRVWFKRTPGDRSVSVSVTVPYGSDEDPPGKEQLAHFTEHMLFTDRPGRTEEQVKRAITLRGGTRNGITMPDRTFYFARVDREHGLFAIEWLHGIMAPHAMPRALVARQRTPVMIETRARPRDVGEWVFARVIDPPALRVPDYWGREFGIRSHRARDSYPWRSIRAIDSADLRAFYDRYYVPSRMTLTIVGDLDSSVVWPLVTRTYGTLPARPVPPPRARLVDPGREHRRYAWTFRSAVGYDERYKLYGRTARDDLLLTFVSRHLGQRLGEQLRFGTRKAVYGLSVGVERRGQAAHLALTSDIATSALDFARGRIDRELARLRAGAVSDSEFVAGRDAIIRALVAETTAAQSLESWVTTAFYAPDVHARFPDVAGELAGVTRDEVATFARRLLAPERRVLSIVRPMPLSQPALLLLGWLVLWLGWRLARRLFQRPLPMVRLRYLTRVAAPLAWRLAIVGTWIAVVLVTVRLLVFGFQLIAARWLAGVDSFAVQYGAYALMAIVVVLLLVAALAVVPRTVLVFDDALAIKAIAFRSRVIPFARVVEVAERRLGDVMRLGGVAALARCRPLAPAILAPALHIRLDDGSSYLLRSRDTGELRRVLDGLRGTA